MMQALMKKILEADYFTYMHPHFLFRDMESLYSDNIVGNWSTVNGGTINMLPKSVLSELYTKLFVRF